jgi:hypothetical protein
MRTVPECTLHQRPATHAMPSQEGGRPLPVCGECAAACAAAGRAVVPIEAVVGDQVDDDQVDVLADQVDDVAGLVERAGVKDLDHCPRCGRPIADFASDGCEAPTGQRWCLEHAPAGWDDEPDDRYDDQEAGHHAVEAFLNSQKAAD